MMEREKLRMLVRVGIMTFSDGCAGVNQNNPTYRVISATFSSDRDIALGNSTFTELNATLSIILGKNDLSESIVDTVQSTATMNAITKGKKFNSLNLDEYIRFLADIDYCLFKLGEAASVAKTLGQEEERLNVVTGTYMLLLSHIVGVALYGDYGCVETVSILRKSLEESFSHIPKWVSNINLGSVDFRNAIRA